MASGETHCVTSTIPAPDGAANYGPYHLAEVRWDANGRDLVVWFRNSRTIKLLRYAEESGLWRTVDEKMADTTEIPEPESKLRPMVSIKQSFDEEPPTLWISDSEHSGKPLWNPNPQLSHMALGKASLYQWTDKSGAHWTGGLVLPVGYRAGTKYPLVIQTHGVWDKMFMTDGCFPVAMSARPLASAGFVVLQMGLVNPGLHTGSPTEADEAAAGIDGAIEKLISDGLIDPSRIGITGFSRTSWHIETELVKHPHRFAAAIMADGIDESYMQYILFGDGHDNLREESERINQGLPFGANLTKWFESSATFHLDRLTTPVRVEAHGPESLLGEWQIYASLRLQHKPVDLIYFLGEQHILQNPADRFVSQQGAVDWYRYWLKGEEDSDPRKRSQYRRWENLRAERDSQGERYLEP
jgi:dipeptidyl aminopeptidase/acylaminoacyl peptidase